MHLQLNNRAPLPSHVQTLSYLNHCNWSWFGQWSSEFTQCIQHTFNRATNLVMDNLTSELRSHISRHKKHPIFLLFASPWLWTWIYWTWMRPIHPLCSQDVISHQPIHSRATSFMFLPPSWTCQYHSKYSNVCNNTTLIPKPKQLQRCASLHYYIFPRSAIDYRPHDTNLDNTRTCHIQRPSHLDSASLIAFTHSPLVNRFGEPTTGISTTASHVAGCLISLTLH
jgi:hypothetical protein